MKTRKATPEQIAAKQDRILKCRNISKVVSKWSEAQKIQFLKRFNVVSIETGNQLSLHNTLLCLSFSKSVPTIVGGYKQWQAHGRNVRKGEKALPIWIPTNRKEVDGVTGEELMDRYFVLGSVFDISQTDEIGVINAEFEVEAEPVALLN